MFIALATLMALCWQLDQMPLYDPLFTVANTTVGRDVRTVIIAGEVVMKDREIVSIDVERIRAMVASRLPRLMERLEAITQ